LSPQLFQGQLDDMKTLAAFALAVLCATSAYAGTAKPATAVKVDPKTIATNCNTLGDALGSLQITVVGRTMTLIESGMDGSTTRTRLEQSGTDPVAAVNALLTGKPVNLWYRGPKATEFGGAVMNAGLLALGGKQANGSRSGFLSRRDIVYMLTCKP
jgi:hypothetical protein